MHSSSFSHTTNQAGTKGVKVTSDATLQPRSRDKVENLLSDTPVSSRDLMTCLKP